jgi:hypothetical protein
MSEQDLSPAENAALDDFTGTSGQQAGQAAAEYEQRKESGERFEPSAPEPRPPAPIKLLVGGDATFTAAEAGKAPASTRTGPTTPSLPASGRSGASIRPAAAQTACAGSGR